MSKLKQENRRTQRRQKGPDRAGNVISRQLWVGGPLFFYIVVNVRQLDH